MIKKFLHFLNLTKDLPLVDKQYIPSKEEKIYSLFNTNLYEKKNIEKIESWLFYNYFDQSDNLTEQKYKIAILGLVFNQKNLYIEEMPLVDDIVKDISLELIKQKETEVNLYEIFPERCDFTYMYFVLHKQIPQKPTGLDLFPQILNEDKNNFETINLFKETYQQFSCLGLLAESFINSKSHTELLIDIQESKFTKYDIKKFKNFINEVSDPSYYKYHSVRLSLSCWVNLISNENDPNNLNLFKEVYLNDEGKSDGGFFAGLYNPRHINTREEDKAYLIQLVEKRIEYLDLDNYLDEQPKIPVNKVKRNKL